MKCKDCIFAKDKDLGSIECCNPYSNDYEQILFENYDGCMKGKKSTVGIDYLQRLNLILMTKENIL